MLRNTFLVSLVAVFVWGCSDDNDKSGGGDAGGLVTQEDRNRWPETGQYSFSFTFNGCTDEYQVNGKAEYCVALTDQSRSKCNTLRMRKSAYLNECGNDFEPRNIRGYEFSGYDSYLQKSCEASAPGTFQRLRELCNSLKNEALYQGCHWQDRRQYFEDLGCSGEFSLEPSRPVSPPTTNPPNNPQDPSPPTTNPIPRSAYQEMISEYQKMGIKVGLSNSPGSGERLSQADIESISNILLLLKDEFEVRSSFYPVIRLVSSYTSFSFISNQGYLSLDGKLTQAELLKYLEINDSRLALYKSTNVFVDVGVDLHGSMFNRDIAKELRGFQQKIDFFSANAGHIEDLSPLFKEIQLEERNAIQFYDDTLALADKSYQQSFSRLISLIKPFADLARAGVTFKGYVFNDHIEQSDFPKFSGWLSQNRNGLVELVQYHAKLFSDRPFEIDVRTDRAADPVYFQELGLEVRAGVGMNFAGLDEFLGLISTLSAMNAKLESQSLSKSLELDINFVVTSKVLRRRDQKLRSLAGRVEAVYIGASKMGFLKGTLYVPKNVTLAELDRVLNSIR